MNASRVPQAVVFDLGKVLLDFDYGILARRMASQSSISAEEILRVVNQTPLLHRYETGLISDREFYEAVVTATGFRGTEEEFLNWLTEYLNCGVIYLRENQILQVLVLQLHLQRLLLELQEMVDDVEKFVVYNF
jgi:hypothetical protein